MWCVYCEVCACCCGSEVCWFIRPLGNLQTVMGILQTREKLVPARKSDRQRETVLRWYKTKDSGTAWLPFSTCNGVLSWPYWDT